MGNEGRVRELLDTLLEGELVPFLSLWVVVGGLVVSGFDHDLILESSTLLFYAVLVGVWTSLAPTGPLQDGGNYAQLEFLLIATAAVVVGIGIEVVLGQVSGQMYAIQALALAVLGSRLYVNTLGGETVFDAFRLDRPSERYLVYLPSVVGVATPAVLFQLGYTAIAGYGLGTREAFGIVAALGLALGATGYVGMEVVGPYLMRAVRSP